MTLYNISQLAQALGVHSMSVRRWMEMQVIEPKVYSFNRYCLFDPIEACYRIAAFTKHDDIRLRAIQLRERLERDLA